MLPDPKEQSSLTVLRSVQAGISRAQASAGQLKRVRLPITPQLLRQIKSALDSSSDPCRRCAVRPFWVFLTGELLSAAGITFNPRLHMAWGNVAVDDPQDPKMVRVHLQQSKTDQMGQGAHVTLGRTNSDLHMPSCCSPGQRSKPWCTAWHILSCWTQERSPFGSLRLLPSFEKTLVFLSTSTPATASGMGAATTAVLAGVEDLKSSSSGGGSAALRYVRVPQDRLAALSSTLAGQGCPKSPVAHVLPRERCYK